MLKTIPSILLRRLEFQALRLGTCRYASYYKSNVEESPDKYTAFEKSFKEWKYVEKLMPPTHVPDPPTEEMPSGWKPATLTKNAPYIVRRTKNHLLPIYLIIWRRGDTRMTTIGKVEGDIWQCERDVGEYLQEGRQAVIITNADEIHRKVVIKGDHIEAVKKWAVEKGF